MPPQQTENSVLVRGREIAGIVARPRMPAATGILKTRAGVGRRRMHRQAAHDALGLTRCGSLSLGTHRERVGNARCSHRLRRSEFETLEDIGRLRVVAESDLRRSPYEGDLGRLQARPAVPLAVASRP